jgi:hypothetical protein
LEAKRRQLKQNVERQDSLQRQIWDLVKREAELRAADRSSGGVPRDTGGESPRVDNRRLSERKVSLGLDLDRIRKAGNWSADHHYQVGMLIGFAKTFEELEIVEKLMRDYAACYDTKNLRRAAVLANARAGMYKTGGERIAALDKIAVDFNTCAGKAGNDFTTARGRSANPGK